MQLSRCAYVNKFEVGSQQPENLPPTWFDALVETTGLEPVTFCVQGRCSPN